MNQGLDPLIPNEPLKPTYDQMPFRTGTQPNLEELEQQREELFATLGKKHGVRIASLNVRGRAYGNRKDKWKDLTTMIRKNNILVLAIQESHLNEEEAEKLRERHPKLIIESNGKEMNKEGVAFVMNKDLMVGKTWTHTSLTVGRVSRLQINCGQGLNLDLINVYGPNDEAEKPDFIKSLNEDMKWAEDMENPVLLGDFNFVEEEVDGFPRRHDKNRIRREFLKLKKNWGLVDGWRMQHPTTRDFTFEETNQSMARIDRIYVSDKIYPSTYGWNITNPGNISDHHMVSVDILKRNLPYIGEGIWRMDHVLLEDNVFMKKTEKILKKAENRMMKLKNLLDQRTQDVWSETKKQIKNAAKRRLKE